MGKCVIKVVKCYYAEAFTCLKNVMNFASRRGLQFKDEQYEVHNHVSNSRLLKSIGTKLNEFFQKKIITRISEVSEKDTSALSRESNKVNNRRMRGKDINEQLQPLVD